MKITRRILIGAGGALVLAASSGMMYLTDTWQACWATFVTEANTCCNIGSPTVVQNCIEGAADAFGICLNNLEGGAPSNCHEEFRILLISCDGGLVCGQGHPTGLSGCCSAARAFNRWCAGRTVGYGDLDSTPIWSDAPGTIEFGDPAELIVSTDDSDVAGVVFVAFRPGAASNDPDRIFLVGNASSDPQGGDEVEWTLNSDTDNWPLSNAEDRVMIWAEASKMDGGVKKIWDVSMPIFVDIDR